MKSKKIAILVGVLAIGLLGACKKKTSDPEPEPEAQVTPVNQLCDGNGSASYYPLDSTNNWVYLYKISGITQSPKPNLKVVGHVTYNSLKYAHIYDSALFTDHYYRENSTTHSIYRYNTSNSTDYLEVPGSPTLNQTWTSAYGTRTVTNLSASKSTSGCSYTGLLEITEVNTAGTVTTKFYYKKGLGLVYYIETGSFPGEWTITSTTLK